MGHLASGSTGHLAGGSTGLRCSLLHKPRHAAGQHILLFGNDALNKKARNEKARNEKARNEKARNEKARNEKARNEKIPCFFFQMKRALSKQLM
jgi:hypothetical protein